MKRRVRIGALTMATFFTLIWLNNTSVFSPGDDEPLFIAHRGLAPEMYPEHEDNIACLGRIHASEHSFIENTIPSINAAFNFGADYAYSTDTCHSFHVKPALGVSRAFASWNCIAA